MPAVPARPNPPRPERLASLRRPGGPSIARLGNTAPKKSAPPRQTCPTCTTPDIQITDAGKVCLNCGTLVSEENIVAEVTFGETASGAAVVQGAFVADGQRHAKTLSGALLRRTGGGGGDSREVTESNGRDEIRKLTAALRLNPSIDEQALNIYKLAVANNFIQGRRVRTVAAVCIYVACRRNKGNTVLLMDLSEIIRVNVFKLGNVYTDLMKDLWLGDFAQSGVAPVIEVEPLLLKFARKLEFGSATHRVAEDAAKIIKRMNRDWMVTGRRPAGLCGACIILAARMNNFRRSVREVVYVVKVADVTIHKRLVEFKRTRSSDLTVEEFREYGNRLRQQHDPPALYYAKMKEEKRRKVLGLDQPVFIPDDASSTAGTPEPQQQQQQRRRETRRDADGFVIPDLPIDPSLLPAGIAVVSPLGDDQEQGVAATAMAASKSKRGRPKGTTHKRKHNPEPNNPEPQAAGVADLPAVDLEGPPKKKRGRPKREPPPPLTPEDLIVEEELENEIERYMQAAHDVANVEISVFEAGQKRAKVLADTLRPSVISESEAIREDEFDDDPEVANCLLSPEEVVIKEKIWVTHNEDWLRMQQAKLLKRALEEAANGGKKPIKRTRRKGRMGDGSVLEGSPVESPADANERMLMRRSKGFSKLINYDKLNAIYKGTEGERQAASISRSASTGSGSGEGSPAPSVERADSEEATASRADADATRHRRAATPAEVIHSVLGGPAVFPTPPATQTVTQRSERPAEEDEAAASAVEGEGEDDEDDEQMSYEDVDDEVDNEMDEEAQEDFDEAVNDPFNTYDDEGYNEDG